MKFSFFAAVAALLFVGALVVSPLVPGVATAETYIIPDRVVGCSASAYTNCAPGVLHVYVDASGRSAVNFTAIVTAQNSAPISFFGSVNGTNLSVSGQYTVTVEPRLGYTPSYSAGCTGVLLNKSEATCVVSMRGDTAYFNTVTPYPYPYMTPSLTCAARYSTVGLGQTAIFDAVGTVSGPYNWQTPERSYLSTGSRISVVFMSTGVKQVTVMSGIKAAQCVVEVVPNQIALPIDTISYSGMYYAPSTYVPAQYYTPVAPTVLTAPAVLTRTFVPRLPNTGFAPITAVQMAFVVAALASLAALVLPYVRKIVGIIL